MNVVSNDMPFIALIDDDGHSAHLLTRMLVAHGAPQVRHVGSAEAGETFLIECLSDVDREWPGLVIVDLKAHSGANLEFVTRHQAVLRQKGIPLAVMMQTTDRVGRQALQEAGAAAVFFRQAELEAYRREAAAIVSFWARNQRLDAVGM